MGVAPLHLTAQADIGTHVVNQHYPIRGGLDEPATQDPLQLQRGQHKGQHLPQSNGAHGGSVCQQLGTGCLHAAAPQGHHLEGNLAPPGLQVQRFDQQRSLQITGHLAGAHKQAHHQRWAGKGPRRPGPVDASRKLHNSSARGSSDCCRAWSRASASTRSVR